MYIATIGIYTLGRLVTKVDLIFKMFNTQVLCTTNTLCNAELHYMVQYIAQSPQSPYKLLTMVTFDIM